MGFFHVPHGVPLLERVAQHLLDVTHDDPARLSRALVLLPTRRAARALAAAFLRARAGAPLLLPRMVAIGDIDQNPLFLSLADGLAPPIAKLARTVALAELIRRHLPEQDLTPDRALRLADDLAALLDEAAEAECDLSGLSRLAPEDFARHWQRTQNFLEIATLRWRADLAARGLSEPVARRIAMLRRLPGWLARHAQAVPVLAVGIAAAAPAQAALLQAIAALPQGQVLLAGLDTTMTEAGWQALDASHPQAELKALLDRLGLARAAIPRWPHAGPAEAARAALLATALLPAAALDWRARPPASATAGMALLVAPDSQSEARAIALAVREALEQPDARIAVITPDRAQAERIAAALARWNVPVEDSAAMPLSRTPPGALLRLVAEALARDLAPVPLLSLVRHPLVAGSMAPEAFRRAGRNFELAALRGARPDPRAIFSPAVLGEKWRDNREIQALQRALGEALAPLAALFGQANASPRALLRETVAAAEALAATDATPGAARLWQGPEGAALSRHVTACDAALEALGPIAPRWWPDLLEQLLAQAAVRTRGARAAQSHPRVEVLGVLEARLLTHDVVVLAGLNEGTWPAIPDPGAWLSRQQRAELKLAAPEAAVGFSAADFVAAACGAGRVILARAQKVEGEPAVASRWLTRLVALAGEAALEPATDHVALAALLDRDAAPRPERRPEPRPRLAARPRQLPVTSVERLVANPYGVYARRVLQLRPLDPLDQEADAADWGTLVHDAARDFVRQCAAAWPADPARAFLDCAATQLERFGARPGLVALWRPRLETLAPWLAAHLASETAQARLAEQDGAWTFAGPAGGFVLTARADRIDIGADGRLSILDYKTGEPPSGAAVRDGRALQLPLTALIAAAGGFPAAGTAQVARLAYVRLAGGPEPGKLRVVAREAEVAEAMAEADALLRRLVATYDDPATGYRAMAVEDDYAHLSRRQGWGVVGEGA